MIAIASATTAPTAPHTAMTRAGAMVLRGGSRQDHDYSLAQAYTALGEAEGLAALFLRRCAHEGGVGGELVGGAQARREQDQQRAG